MTLPVVDDPSVLPPRRFRTTTNPGDILVQEGAGHSEPSLPAATPLAGRSPHHGRCVSHPSFGHVTGVSLSAESTFPSHLAGEHDITLVPSLATLVQGGSGRSTASAQNVKQGTGQPRLQTVTSLDQPEGPRTPKNKSSNTSLSSDIGLGKSGDESVDGRGHIGPPRPSSVPLTPGKRARSKPSVTSIKQSLLAATAGGGVGVGGRPTGPPPQQKAIKTTTSVASRIRQFSQGGSPAPAHKSPIPAKQMTFPVASAKPPTKSSTTPLKPDRVVLRQPTKLRVGQLPTSKPVISLTRLDHESSPIATDRADHPSSSSPSPPPGMSRGGPGSLRRVGRYMITPRVSMALPAAEESAGTAGSYVVPVVQAVPVPLPVLG